ncbi:hypothetical protein BJY04DRAFT_224076 [Aspergillus karnatakaensis]|uniref:uncharacterized protein n=1 Tax=Aspergillus karnatakaensis TaxID=1810916 RepID=UPI003CCE1E64
MRSFTALVTAVLLATPILAAPAPQANPNSQINIYPQSHFNGTPQPVSYNDTCTAFAPNLGTIESIQITQTPPYLIQCALYQDPDCRILTTAITSSASYLRPYGVPTFAISCIR